MYPDPVTATGSVRPPRLRLECLDGLRGLAALYVVFFHIGVSVQPVSETLGRPWRLLSLLTGHGHDAVVVFIVLSGFVLMLPVARSANGILKGGMAEYFRRRARRILPPYGAALLIALALGLIWHLAFMHNADRQAANPFVHNPTPMGIASHFVLLHNVFQSWALSVDSPMWSVATEWQIYFFFPLVLLPLWRRFGLAASVAVGFLIGMIPVAISWSGVNVDTFGCPWFLGAFALGMAAAVIGTSARVHPRLQSPRVWAIAAFLAFLAIAFMEIGLTRIWRAMGDWSKDIFIGAAVSLLLIYFLRSELQAQPKQSLLTRWLGSPALVALGAFSYSLYLVHEPVVAGLAELASNRVAGSRYVVFMYVSAVPLSMLVGYAFHLAFERPDFVNRLGTLWTALGSSRKAAEAKPIAEAPVQLS